MLGKIAAQNNIGKHEDFAWRGGEITRIEGFSDAVFAFVVTLLIVSLEVPKNYEELMENLRGFIPFAASFWQLMIVWYLQYIFFRRYGLQDFKTIVLTMLLVFFVLFFAFPLKFVFNTWLDPHAAKLTSIDQLPQLFTIYGIAWVAIFGVFFFMYRHALSRRAYLGLTELEEWDTRHSMREMLLYMSVGMFAVLVAQIMPAQYAWISGPCYGLIGLAMSLHGRWSGKKRHTLKQQVAV
jgi:uncharacterized membrane protein